MSRLVALAGAWVLGLALTVTSAAAADLALVIGNHDYARAPTAVSAKADAEAVAHALRQGGYDVIFGTDLNRNEMRQTLARFARRVGQADRVVVFYSGLALRVDGRSYLSPVDQTNHSLVDVMMDGVPLDLVLRLAAEGSGKAVVFIDGAQLHGYAPHHFAEPGLAHIRPPKGVLVVSAAAPGRATARRSPGESEFARKVVHDFLAPGASVSQAVQQIGSPAWVAGDTSSSLVLVSNEQAGGGGTSGASPAQTEDQLNLSRSQRSQIQQNLTTLGYDTRGTGGIFGGGTRTAIRNWQQANNLNVTGYLTQAQIALISQQAQSGSGGPSAAQVEDQLNLSRSERSQIQQSLNSLGYDTRGTSGAFGAGTRTAIRNWQRANNLNETGYLTQAQIALINQETSQGNAGNNGLSPAQVEDQLNLSGSERSRIQENLTTLGYDTRGTGGAFGPGTRTAIRNWQRDNNHNPTGYLTSQQVAQIDRQAGQGGSGNASPAQVEDQLNLSRPERSRIQENLTTLGYDTRGTGGIFGPGTRSAIRNWQRSNNHDETGYLTSRQVAQIDRQAAQAGGGGQGPSNPAATEAALNLSRTDRLSIEQRLAYLGFPPGPQDGFFDSNTRQAISDYQRSRGYPVTGYLDRQTLHGIVSETRNVHTGIVTGAQLLRDLLQGLGGNQQ